MAKHIIALEDSELEIIRNVMHEYKDVYRGTKEYILPVMALEKNLSSQTAGAYDPDTTYDIR